MAQSKEVAFNLDDEAFASDHFRMYEFKVKRCPQARPHDWTRCPFAHPGEKAKRRDPRKYQYSGTACPEFRKSGCCRRGDACPFAHGVFECWCHPSRYRTQICTDGTNCKRRVCFFAHLESEVRKRDDSNVPLGAQTDLADAQIQQQEVAQAFQVLMNANAQNPGSLAGLNLMSSLGMMGQGSGAHLPLNPLAERAQQLQQQLQQLQALQALQQPMSAPQMQDQLPGYDSLALQGQLLAGNVQSAAQLQQARLDRTGQELLLSAAQQPQQQQPAMSMMAPSPFARAPLGSAFGDSSRHGTPPLDLGHAISLPNPDALRQAGVSPGLQQGSGFLGGVAHNNRINALRMPRRASLENTLPGHLGAPGTVNGDLLSSLGPRTSSCNLGPAALPQTFGRAGSQPVGPSDAFWPAASRPPAGLSGRFGSVSGPHPFASQHGQRRSIDASGDLSEQTPGTARSQPLGMGSQPLQSLHEELGVNMSSIQGVPNSALDALSGLSLNDRAGSGWLPSPPRLVVQQAGSLGTHGSLSQALSAQGSPSMALSPAPSLQSQLSATPSVGSGVAPKPPLGGAGPLSKLGPSRLSEGSPPGAAAFAVAVGSQPVTAPPAKEAPTSNGKDEKAAAPASSSPELAQTSAPVPPPPAGPSVAALAAARSHAQTVYETQGRPPAIREDQPLVGVYGMLPRGPLGAQDSDALRVPSYIGRNASFDQILAELPRSLSEVAMQAGNTQHAGNPEGPINLNSDSLDNSNA